MVDRAKLGHKLAFCVHEGHLSLIGLELLADAFTAIELQEIGRHLHHARLILETKERAGKMRHVIRKFTGEGE